MLINQFFILFLIFSIVYLLYKKKELFNVKTESVLPPTKKKRKIKKNDISKKYNYGKTRCFSCEKELNQKHPTSCFSCNNNRLKNNTDIYKTLNRFQQRF